MAPFLPIRKQMEGRPPTPGRRGVREGGRQPFCLRSQRRPAAIAPQSCIAVVGQAGAEEMNQERFRRVAGDRHGCRHDAVSFVPMRDIGGRTPSPGIRPPPRSRPALSSCRRKARRWRRRRDGGAAAGTVSVGGWKPGWQFERPSPRRGWPRAGRTFACASCGNAAICA